MLLLKPPYKRLHFINMLLSPNFCTFSDTEPFLHSYPIFSAFLNLNFLTKRTPKFKVPEILPGALSPNQIEPKSPKDLKLMLILIMKQVYTYMYFWKTMPTGDLISLTLILLAFSKSSQIGPSSSNHQNTTARWFSTSCSFCFRNKGKKYKRTRTCCLLKYC